MSRIGRLPVVIPKGVSIAFDKGKNIISVKGPKGTLTQWIDSCISVNITDQAVNFQRSDEEQKTRAKHGLYRALVNNMVHGVTQGFEKSLEINGVGYKADLAGKKLTLILGYSHLVEYNIPEGIECKVEKGVKIWISGLDRVLVGQVAAKIRGFKKADVYQLKGIKYTDEVIKKKAGKTGK